MECNVSGIPDPEIHWKKDSRLISPDPRLLITDNGLTIRNILATDNGTYTCVANNSAGTKGQVSILHVLGKNICSKRVY